MLINAVRSGRQGRRRRRRRRWRRANTCRRWRRWQRRDRRRRRRRIRRRRRWWRRCTAGARAGRGRSAAAASKCNCAAYQRQCQRGCMCTSHLPITKTRGVRSYLRTLPDALTIVSPARCVALRTIHVSVAAAREHEARLNVPACWVPHLLGCHLLPLIFAHSVGGLGWLRYLRFVWSAHGQQLAHHHHRYAEQVRRAWWQPLARKSFPDLLSCPLGIYCH